jgi:hypothetical protein
MNKIKLDLVNNVTSILFVVIFLENAFISVLYFDRVKMMLFENSESIFYSEKGDYYWWIIVTSLEWFLLYVYIWGKLIYRRLELFGYFQHGKSQQRTIGNVISFGYRRERRKNINDFLLFKLTNKKHYNTFNKVFWYFQIVLLPLATFFFLLHINISDRGIEVQSIRHIQPKAYNWHDISQVIIYEKKIQTDTESDIIYYTLFTNDHTSVNLLRYVDSYQEVKKINEKLITHRVPVIFQSYDEAVVYRQGTELEKAEKQAFYDIFLKHKN